MFTDIKHNPVRIYTILVSTLTLVVYYLPNLPEPAILGLIAALCGVGGEIVRGNVTPMGKVNDVIADAVAAQLAVKPLVDVTHVDTSPSVRVIQ